MKDVQLQATTEKHIDALHNVILFRVVWMIFGGNFQYGRNGSIVVLQDMSDVIRDELIDENDTDVFPRRQGPKGFFDLWQLSVLLDNQKVGPLGRSMTDSC